MTRPDPVPDPHRFPFPPSASGWVQVLGAFLGLNLLLHLPDLVLGTLPAPPTTYLTDPLRFYYLFSLDLFALFVLLAIVPATRRWSCIRVAVVGGILFLLVYEVYDAVILSMLHRGPIFAADLPHVVGAAHLLRNAALPRLHVLGLGVALGLFGGLAWTLPALIRGLHSRLHVPPLRRGVLGAGILVGALVSLAVVTDQGIDRTTYRSVCFSTTECLARNVKASVNLRQQIAHRQDGHADSTYVGYDTLRWENPPSLYFITIESYGSTLATPPSRSQYDRLMHGVETELRASGWHAASSHSRAPVFGGLSWLSVATLFLGTPVKHQPTFDVLKPRLPRYPHLVRLFQKQGYETAALQPPVRSRPGLPVDNPYGFHRTFYFQDLDYRGPSYGWGIVPDQYSLSVAHDRFVDPATGPFFLFFETVTPHGPWTDPPPPLQNTAAARVRTAPSAGSTAVDLPILSIPRTGTPSPSWSNAESSIERLLHHVQYDWDVLSTYLRTQAPSHSLVVVLGDHQPYVANDRSTATPLHVLSPDETLVRRFEKYGLTPGLRPSSASDTLHHAGLYSLLARVLTQHYGDGRSGHLPAYRPQGVERAALLPSTP